MSTIDRLAEAVHPLVEQFSWAVLAYFVIVNGFYLVLLVSASWELREHAFEVAGESRHRVLSSRVAPRIGEEASEQKDWQKATSRASRWRRYVQRDRCRNFVFTRRPVSL